ncbi:hypothetical protein M6D93_13140 [Jatrophihabitans telluris]|uniref:Uncharacterized protein n=1 Tax=Jatrophihabitans telluris TaxID=2038343 RepID=A0ABY4QUB6_9ACTN|nr:hypothetical protein [Jatrophihabitans telluris]UQX87243.1 hypothetical protein M6D93_13140 [Jatrophihabitans telluris]
MLIDCDSCAMRDLACADCVVTVLLGPRPVTIELDSAEEVALGALAGGGLLPPLRLVPTIPPGRPPSAPHVSPTTAAVPATVARQADSPVERVGDDRALGYRATG